MNARRLSTAALPLLAASLAGACGGSIEEPSETSAATDELAACGTVYENSSLKLTCPSGQVIRAIDFASYGTPRGSCGAFSTSSCNSSTSMSVVSTACSGKASCTVRADNATFGDPCRSTRKRLAVQMTCGDNGGSPDAGTPISIPDAGVPVPSSDAGLPIPDAGAGPSDAGPGGGASASRYSELPNGAGGFNLEQVSYPSGAGLDRAASLAAFQSTVYPLLRAHCAGCHSTETRAQAPIHSDSDVDLAHAYALTRVDFRHPEDSELVAKPAIYRHNCFGRNCADAGAQIKAAVEAWSAAVRSSLPPVPQAVPVGVQVSDQEVRQWIASDRAKLPTAEVGFFAYVSLHEMHNAGVPADRLNVARAALSKALNSTARWAPRIVNPVDIDGKGMVYRFDIRSYWGYNKGVRALIFGGSDDDIFFGDKTDLLGHRFNFSPSISQDAQFAQRVWARVQEGSKEAYKQSGAAENKKGFQGDFVELSQLVYTLSRPDVYNAIMALPIYATELEDELGVVKSNGVQSYQYVVVKKAITIAPRQMFRAPLKTGGFYWKSFDIFTGQGQVFPFWEHPIPKFISLFGGNASDWSLMATLAQPDSNDVPQGCNPAGGSFQNFITCTTYTGTGGVQQHASEVIWSLPNGLQGYAIFGGLNQRRTDAFSFIVHDPRRLRSASDAALGGAFTQDVRLILGASCMGCHSDGMKRENGDLRDPLDQGSLQAAWVTDAGVADQVRKLYPPSSALRPLIESDRRPFFDAMAQIRDGMMVGEDKNLPVEPIVWTFEWAQRHYGYADTVSN